MVEELERQTGDVKAGVEHKSEANVKNSPVHLHTVSSRQRFAIERKAARPLTLSLKLMTSKIFEGTVSECTYGGCSGVGPWFSEGAH